MSRRAEQEIVFAGRQNVRVGDGPRCDYPRDLPLYELDTFLRGLHLVADSDLVTLAKQPRDIAVRRVVGYPAHRHGILAVLVTRG